MLLQGKIGGSAITFGCFVHNRGCLADAALNKVCPKSLIVLVPCRLSLFQLLRRLRSREWRCLRNVLFTKTLIVSIVERLLPCIVDFALLLDPRSLSGSVCVHVMSQSVWSGIVKHISSLFSQEIGFCFLSPGWPARSPAELSQVATSRVAHLRLHLSSLCSLCSLCSLKKFARDFPQRCDRNGLACCLTV